MLRSCREENKMITVTIFINDTPIITRGAVNTGEVDKQGRTIYKVDDGRILKHKREDKAIKLVKMMLDGVVEL
jgi:hypothetical protein